MQASAAAESQMDQTAQMARALQQQEDLFDNLKVSGDDHGLSALQATMHDAYRCEAQLACEPNFHDHPGQPALIACS